MGLILVGCFNESMELVRLVHEVFILVVVEFDFFRRVWSEEFEVERIEELFIFIINELYYKHPFKYIE